MGNPKTMAQAKLELEELYSGIPDDSVNLTFQDLANLQNERDTEVTEKNKTTNMEAVKESVHTLNKLPSLDLNAGLQASKSYAVSVDGHLVDSEPRNKPHRERGGLRRHRQNNAHHHHRDDEDMEDSHLSRGGDQIHVSDIGGHQEGSKSFAEFRHALDQSSMVTSPFPNVKGGKSRRPGIPHSNICTICSTYIYFFRHRCLVCGRAYCRSCWRLGMGDMSEGRKCIDCLGKRFSQRYIQRAGKISCWTSYPKNVKHAEVKWAEKGPRRNGEGRTTPRNMSVLTPTGPRSPMTPRSPAANYNWSPSRSNNTSPFVPSSPYSPYSPSHRHHIPF